jgi:hypothetical protein
MMKEREEPRRHNDTEGHGEQGNEDDEGERGTTAAQRHKGARRGKECQIIEQGISNDERLGWRRFLIADFYRSMAENFQCSILNFQGRKKDLIGKRVLPCSVGTFCW